MPAAAPPTRRFRDFALLPRLPVPAQWHLLEAAFLDMREAGPASFAPALGAMAAYVLLNHTWCLAWMMSSLGAVVLGQRVAAAFDLRTSDSQPSVWARRHALTAWAQAALVGGGGLGATSDHRPEACLLIAFPLGLTIVQAGAAATLTDSVRGQIGLLTLPLVASCLMSGTPLFAVIAALFTLQAVAAFSLANSAVARAEAVAQSELNRAHPAGASKLAHAPLAADFQRLLGRDHCTGLPNRHSFMHMLAEESTRAARAETQLSILLLQWDEFEPFRAAHSQTLLDQRVELIARRLREHLQRPADMLGSLGGGRFGVLLAFTDAFGAATVARKLQIAVSAPDMLVNAPEIAEGALEEPAGEIDLSAIPVSIGAATYCGKGPLPETQLMFFAEEALQNARRIGPNTIRRYDPLATTAPLPPYQGGRPSEVFLPQAAAAGAPGKEGQ